VGQRYRIIYSIDAEHARVHVVAAGLRRQGARDDIYELAQRLVRLGLAPAPARSKSAGRARRRPKKK
jgi:mRNA interferase RelE/StbE